MRLNHRVLTGPSLAPRVQGAAGGSCRQPALASSASLILPFADFITDHGACRCATHCAQRATAQYAACCATEYSSSAGADLLVCQGRAAARQSNQGCCCSCHQNFNCHHVHLCQFAGRSQVAWDQALSLPVCIFSFPDTANTVGHVLRGLSSPRVSLLQGYYIYRGRLRASGGFFAK